MNFTVKFGGQKISPNSKILVKIASEMKNLFNNKSYIYYYIRYKKKRSGF